MYQNESTQLLLPLSGYLSMVQGSHTNEILEPLFNALGIMVLLTFRFYFSFCFYAFNSTIREAYISIYELLIGKKK